MLLSACVCVLLSAATWNAVAERPGLRGFRALQDTAAGGASTDAPIAAPTTAEVDTALQKQCGAQISACTADDVCRSCVANNNPQANPTAPDCEATEKFFDDSFPNCTQRENPAFVEMKKCFVKFVGNAAQLNCDAATDAAATEAPAAAAPATVSGGTRHLLATVTAARELQETPPPTAAATPSTTTAIAGPTPIERAFLQECGQQIQGCGAAPECRACVTNAVKTEVPTPINCDNIEKYVGNTFPSCNASTPAYTPFKQCLVGFTGSL
eukprot:6826-Heterococcus_DN1.PRE.1